MAEPPEKIEFYNKEVDRLMKLEEKKKKLKFIFGFVALVLVIGITITGIAVAKPIKTPKITLGDNIEFLEVVTETKHGPFFNITFKTQLRVDNTNNFLGKYKFERSIATFYHDDVCVGQAWIPEGHVGMRSTKSFDVTVSLSSVGTPMNPNLGRELGVKVLTLVANAKVTGTVETLMKMKKKTRVGELNCFLILDLSNRMVKDMSCDF